MNFAEIIYQSALFTATFFIFNRLFSRFIFKNREVTPPTLSNVIGMFLFFIAYNVILGYVLEKYTTPTKQQEQQTLVSGQGVVAPVSCDVQAPLKSVFDFEEMSNGQEELTTVVTDKAEYVFSAQAATLQSITLLWQEGTKRIALLPQGLQHFAIAFNGISPTTYRLVRSELVQDGKIHEVVYQAAYGSGTIQKIFLIHCDTYQIDVRVKLDGVSIQEPIYLLIPAPLLHDELIGVVNSASVTDRIKLTDIRLDKAENLQQFWFEPKVFGFSSKFFTNVCFASSSQALGRVYFKQSADQQYQAVLESKSSAKNASELELSWSFYFGPKTIRELQAVAPELTSIIQYGMLSPLAKPLANLLVYTKEQTGNYGLAIVLVALLLKLLMLPFTLRSERSMRQQAEFEKKRTYLQQKYKHDKAALDQATAELIQKHGMPIFSGCLPMLLNIPVFIALNKVLTTSTELYGASFLWLPDLSAADPLYILSLVTFVGMIFSPGMQTGPRQVFSRIGFALFVAAITSYLASGLALFVVLNTLFGVLQSWATRNVRWLSARYA